MFLISKKNNSKPYKTFFTFLDRAKKCNQKSIDAISISSFNKEKDEVRSRYVNLKYIINDEWIFFSNYNSPKSNDFASHNQVSVLIYWETIDLQIRIKALINKTDNKTSDIHFMKRSEEKNALAISSDQSSEISKYEDVVGNYKNALENENLKIRPDYWGGFSFFPFYFEFWEGKENRLNKRTSYKKNNGKWLSKILEP